MAMIDENSMKKVTQTLTQMKGPVKLVLFKEKNHEPSELLEQFAKELAQANPLISVEVHGMEDAAAVKEYSISQPGTMCLVGAEKRNLKVLGLPSGYEFFPFLQTILDVSRGGADLPRDIEQKIRAISKPINMKVFVTPTCPYCPAAVRLAHTMALINPNISSEMVEANEFPELSGKYQVSGVPKTVINDVLDLVGAYPPDVVLKKISEL